MTHDTKSGDGIFTAVGLMSGTSLDGIDAALIRTDGERVLDHGPSKTIAYPDALRERVRAVLGATARSEEIDRLEFDITRLQAAAVDEVLAEDGLTFMDIDLIGFHGQTITHAPDQGWTWQLGDGAQMARETFIATVHDFRSADMKAGGQGAPLAPVYHRALAASLDGAIAVLNLGGVGNITLLDGPEVAPIAFDTGPGNALIDDLVARSGRDSMDRDGVISRMGRVDSVALAALMSHPYFSAPIPKSLDRNAFDASPVAGLSLEDAAATLAAFTVESVRAGLVLAEVKPARVLVTGGGRLNPTIMLGLRDTLDAAISPVEAVQWNGDMLEAEAFAFMAVRSVLGLPISFPGTTGVSAPMTGGTLAPWPPKDA